MILDHYSPSLNSTKDGEPSTGAGMQLRWKVCLSNIHDPSTPEIRGGAHLPSYASIWEPGVGASEVQDHPWLHRGQPGLCETRSRMPEISKGIKSQRRVGGLVTDDHRESQLLTGNSRFLPTPNAQPNKIPFLLLFVGTSAHGIHGEARGLAGVDSALLPFEIRESKSGLIGSLALSNRQCEAAFSLATVLTQP